MSPIFSGFKMRGKWMCRGHQRPGGLNGAVQTEALGHSIISPFGCKTFHIISIVRIL